MHATTNRHADVIDREFCRSVFANSADSLFDNNDEIPTRATRKFYAKLVADLTFFVEDVVSSTEISFVPKFEVSGETRYDFSLLAERYFKKIPGFIKAIGMLSSDYRYSEHIDAFKDACAAQDLLNAELVWCDLWHSPTSLVHNEMTGGDSFNALVETVRRDWVQQGHKERFRRRVRESYRLCREYQGYVGAWFNKLATLIVMRVDLSYEKKYWHDIKLNDVVADLDHLCANFRCNKIFRGLRGYIAKIEYGLGKGFHIHMIFLFDTEDKQARNHVFHTQKIGEYWVQTLTKGRGDYWNCNAKAPEYEALGRRGIGPIHVSNLELRSNLSEFVVGYLCKTGQFIRPKLGQQTRLIRRGNWPKPEPKKLGAPRKSHKIAEPFAMDKNYAALISIGTTSAPAFNLSR